MRLSNFAPCCELFTSDGAGRLNSGFQRRQMFVKHLPDQGCIEIVVSMPQMIAYSPNVTPRLTGAENLSVITESLRRLANDQERILRRE
jgi:hypothetical protein